MVCICDKQTQLDRSWARAQKDIAFWESKASRHNQMHAMVHKKLLVEQKKRYIKEAVGVIIGTICLFVGFQSLLLTIIPMYSSTERLIGLLVTLGIIVLLLQKTIRIPTWKMLRGK